MRELYVGRKLTISEVAEKVNCTYKTAQRWLHKHESIGVRTSDNGSEKQKSRVTVKCATCQEPSEVTSSYAEEYDRYFCDRECMSKGYEGTEGEKNRINVECDECSEDIEIYPSRLETQDRYFCDDDCYKNWRSKNKIGENHPCWKGGHVESYGKSWYSWRRKIRERDRCCQNCGIKPDVELDVHHIIPVREFDDPEEAHTFDNLVGLCHQCHPKIEAMPKKQQRQAVGQ